MLGSLVSAVALGLGAALSAMNPSAASANSTISAGRFPVQRVSFNNRDRFLFDVNGDQIDAYGAKVNCKLTFPNNRTLSFVELVLTMQFSVRSLNVP
jgi:hypothetical protein